MSYESLNGLTTDAAWRDRRPVVRRVLVYPGTVEDVVAMSSGDTREQDASKRIEEIVTTEPRPVRRGRSVQPQAFLCIAHGPDERNANRRIQLGRGSSVISLGRDPKNTLSSADSRMSRVHARLRWDSTLQRFVLSDAGSSNGSFVNGTAVESHVLTSGDVIRTGDTLFVYQEGDPMFELRQLAVRVAPSAASVLLLGETGVGKEVIAKLLHAHGGRSGPFVAVNCATLSKELAAAELFGHKRGAFSGAGQARAGLFVAAEGGTLFLDEVCDLPQEVQPTLLRALQENRVRPVGSDSEVETNVRVLAATNADPDEAVEQGRFRDDLLARLQGLVLRLPPLRERRAEVFSLAGEFAAEAGCTWRLEADAAEALLLWHYPHNVRELRSLVFAIAALAAKDNLCILNDKIDLDVLKQIKPDLTWPESSYSRDASDAAERALLVEALSEHRGNVSFAAKALGMSRPKFYRVMRRHGLTLDAFRKGARPDERP